MDHQQVLLQRAMEYLDSQEWHYEVRGEDNNILTLGLNIKCKLRNCKLHIIVSEKDIQTIAVAPIAASADVYSNVVEFITRANDGLKVGKFMFDYNDGEVSYQTCLLCSEGVPALEDVERAVDIAFVMLQKYGDGLVKNLMGFGSPEADIKAIEG